MVPNTRNKKLKYEFFVERNIMSPIKIIFLDKIGASLTVCQNCKYFKFFQCLEM